MENKNQVAEQSGKSESGIESESAGKVDASRRKFTGVGLGVSAIFTLSSHPVLAEVAGVCKSPSGFASGNLSQHGTPIICSGQKPVVWAASTSDAILNTKFHAIFTRTSTVGYGTGQSSSMKDVMAMPGGGATSPQPLGAEVAATWVNIKKGLIPATILTDTKLVTMWNEIVTTGFYTPMTGATPWNAAAVVTYLRSLQI